MRATGGGLCKQIHSHTHYTHSVTSIHSHNHYREFTNTSSKMNIVQHTTEVSTCLSVNCCQVMSSLAFLLLFCCCLYCVYIYTKKKKKNRKTSSVHVCIYAARREFLKKKYIYILDFFSKFSSYI